MTLERTSSHPITNCPTSQCAQTDWLAEWLARTEVVRGLNDAFRSRGPDENAWYFSEGLAELGFGFIEAATCAVQQAPNFPISPRPCAQHDFGWLECRSQLLFWKIDYFNLVKTCGSIDPSDALQTRREMTVMLAREY